MTPQQRTSQETAYPERLLNLSRRARNAKTKSALEFILVNETFKLVHYQIATIWESDTGIIAHSGVSQIDKNSTFILWTNQICKSLSVQSSIVYVTPKMIREQDIDEWSRMLPPQALWIPCHLDDRDGGLLIARDEEWQESEISALAEWISIWQHAYNALEPTKRRTIVNPLLRGVERLIPDPGNIFIFLTDFTRGCGFLIREYLLIPRKWPQLIWKLMTALLRLTDKLFKRSVKESLSSLFAAIGSIWTNTRRRYTIGLLILILLPVRLTILTPAELVPEKPEVVRVPIDGVIEEIFVTPNQKISQGQLLFKLDLTSLVSKLQIAQQELAIASTEHRQTAIQSLNDPKSRSLLNPQEGKTTEKQLEANYLKSMLNKAQIESRRSGIAIFDDPSSWIGKPVSAGEKVMMIATESDMEIEAWIALNDAIPLRARSNITLYLNSTPLSPIQGEIRYIGHEPVARPDGTYAYRLRASATNPNASARIGLRGTAKISGDYVPLLYWIFRKPLATLRQFFGI